MYIAAHVIACLKVRYVHESCYVYRIFKHVNIEKLLCLHVNNEAFNNGDKEYQTT